MDKDPRKDGLAKVDVFEWGAALVASRTENFDHFPENSILLKPEKLMDIESGKKTSQELKQVLAAALNHSPERRPTAAELLKFDWFSVFQSIKRGWRESHGGDPSDRRLQKALDYNVDNEEQQKLTAATRNMAIKVQ